MSHYLGVKGVPRSVVSYGSGVCSQGCSLRVGRDVSDSYLGVRGVPRGVVSELVEMYLTLTWE